MKTAHTQAASETMLCPLRYSLDIVGGKWKLPILCMLAAGESVRYSAIKRKLRDITNMMLSQSLKELEAAGMLHRKQYNEIPPRVEYTLSEKGKSLVPILVQFATWGAEHMQTDTACTVQCATCQQTV